MRIRDLLLDVLNGILLCLWIYLLILLAWGLA